MNNKYNNLKRKEIKNMYFPKVKMADKIQYGNYHEELSAWSFGSFIRLPTKSANVWQKEKL